ncbi:MAG: czcB 4 [Gemmataceae bacterium]|nr:czcB 4 [Gemmataceae bacterium]
MAPVWEEISLATLGIPATSGTGGTLGRRLAGSVGSFVPTAAVLAMFAGLWYWGHKTHWTVPSFAEVTGGASTSATSSAAPAESIGPKKEFVGFPPIRFGSEDEVREAGLVMTTAHRAVLEDVVTATGEVGYNQYRVGQVSCRVPGHVYSIRTRLGQTVKKGDVLALIDSEQVGRAKAEYLQEVFLTHYKTNLLRRFRSTGSGVVPERTILDAEAAMKEAELRRFMTQQRLINLGLTPPDPKADSLTSPEEYARHIQFLGLPDDLIATLQPRPQTANLIPLVSPLDGVVTRQEAVAGDVVSPEKAQFVVADVSVMWINLSVRKEDAGRLRLGQPVRFTAAGLPAPVCGTLEWVGHEADEKTRTLRARCEAANPRPAGAGADEGRLLRANLFGSATVVTGRREGAVVVPDAAVQRMPDGTMIVFVRRPDGVTFDPRRVRTGLSRDGVTEVVTGVEPGEAVVTEGSYVLKSELMKDSLAGS